MPVKKTHKVSKEIRQIKTSLHHEISRIYHIVLTQSTSALKARGYKGLQKTTVLVEVETVVVQTSLIIKWLIIQRCMRVTEQKLQLSHLILHTEIVDLDLPFLATGTQSYGHKNQHHKKTPTNQTNKQLGVSV